MQRAPITRSRALKIAVLLPAVLLAVPVATGQTDGAPPTRRPGVNVLEGRVIDHTGQPVAGARVVAAVTESGFIMYDGPGRIHAYGPDEKVFLFFTKRNGRATGEATTNADGRFAIERLKTGKFNLLAVHAEHGLAVVENVEQPNAGKPFDVRLAAPTFVEGTVKGLPGGGPVHFGRLQSKQSRNGLSLNLSVDLQSQERPMSFGPPADGQVGGPSVRTFKVGPILPGDLWALHIDQYVRKRSFSAPILHLPLDVKAGRTVRLDVDLTSGSIVAGLIRGPKDEPLANVSVIVRSDGERPAVFGAVTGADGTYTIAGMPAGPYTLEAKRWALRTAPG
ncbi:MAG: carboxypeptidase regulatory-like domain-containing protein [Planctomycetes bacterium]|nr:carboxypeptidase regulatory-like domain-containing protein [Planctomycetota bacterium]